MIATMLADPDVAQIHSRNIAYGCYMFSITRRGGTGDEYLRDGGTSRFTS